MAKLPEGDPFDEGDGTPLSVTPGVFEGAAGDEDQGVAGWDTSPKPPPKRRGLYVAISLFVLMALIVPIGVGFFANIRREYIAEQEASGASPAVVELSQEVQEVQARLDPIQAAHLMSSGIAEESVNTEMTSLVDATTASILANDTGKAQSSADSAESYFVATYSQSLPDRATMILENYPYSESDTDARIEELISIIRANSQGQDIGALSAAVIELPQRIGDAMSEHLGNRVTYVPPSDSGTPEPTQPPGTVGPGPSGRPGDTAGFGNTSGQDDDEDDWGHSSGGDDGNQNANANANVNANANANGDDDVQSSEGPGGPDGGEGGSNGNGSPSDDNAGP